MDLREITLNDKIELTKLRSESNCLTALSFQSLYTWQDSLGLEIFLENKLCVIYSIYHKSYFCPLGDEKEYLKFIDKLVKKDQPFKIMYLSKEQAEQLKKIYNADIRINRDLSEYVYESQSLALNQKASRNFKRKVKNFIKNNNYEVTRICNKDIMEIEYLISEHLKDVSLDEDFLALKRAVYAYGELDLQGVILRGDSGNVAFLIGYENISDIFTMAMVKSTPEWQKESVSACIFEMARLICDKYKYVDMEEDLGLSGLRQMKTLYEPVGMLDAWEAEFNFENSK